MSLGIVALLGLSSGAWLFRPRPKPQPVVPPTPTVVGRSRQNPTDGLVYKRIDPGKFTMGCSPGDSECSAIENPVHQVTITKGFWIGATDVTQEAYQLVTGTAPSWFKGGNLPVETVTWVEALSYCQKVGGRLPTEAEWEYAARAGSTSSRYDDLDDVAWYRKNSDYKPHDVKQKEANAYGLYDMLGNVSQWTADWYENYPSGPASDPAVPAPGTKIAVRGGSWWDVPMAVRLSFRFPVSPDERSVFLGFRCVTD